MQTMEAPEEIHEQGDEPQPLILAIETATRAGGVAVVRGEVVLASRVGDPAVSHSTNLIEMIESALNEARAKLSEVDIFAAAVGPGSFTGLRIGLATVKALASVTHRQIAGVSTLAAIAHSTRVEGQVVALLPAGRGEVFAQMFWVSDGDVIAQDAAAHLSPEETIERYDKESDVRWAGEGVEKLSEFLQSESSSLPANSLALLAVSLAALALHDYREGKSVGPDDLHAVYVRASDAEINERWQQQNAQQLARG
jgi:tRNA threonylcarbamoyladenosine biosynthesis protein TsaB